ncbi:T9SS type A sorting domain-containing protein, partial [candidate division WOR-3 bacterium]|nr:T9SS type A sorting domain-containing protein [candidate division WOR-3 bacterium]
TYVYEDTSNFSVIIGEPTIAAPTGPDEHGYWAYDDTDTLYGYAPLYSWFEIAPPGPGSLITAITDEDNATVTLSLPFTFKYYGVDYDSISICSNGFLELGSATSISPYNTWIPSLIGPKAMIAPFWDDLEPDQAGEIYEYYDSTVSVYIIEFDSVNHRGLVAPEGQYETFQVILYNPDSFPSTPTGDGEIVFLYQTVDSSNSNTVGIEDHIETIGIQWLYNNNYAPTAAPLVADRAIKFTTYSPITDSMPWVYVINYMINDSMGGNNNGMPDPGETVELIVYLANGGDSSANNVETILQSSDPDITILDSLASFGNIPAGDTANNESEPYSFVVDSTITDTLADYSLHIYANDSTYETFAYFTVILGAPLGIAEGEHQLPYTYALLQNYPNPMRNNTTIRYQLPKKEKVSLKIYDVVGRLVRTLINELKEPGYYTIHWHGKDDRERKASAGVYFYRIQAGNYTNTKKMVLFK